MDSIKQVDVFDPILDDKGQTSITYSETELKNCLETVSEVSVTSNVVLNYLYSEEEQDKSYGEILIRTAQ